MASLQKANRKPVRDSGIELLRIFMMLQVLFLHICSKNMGGYTTMAAELGGTDLLVYRLLYYMSRCPVYVFIMITGYFSVTGNKTIGATIPKVLRSYWPMLFYAISIPFVGWALQLWTPTSLQMVKAFFPATNRTWYFMTLYLLVVIFSPFINRCLINLSKREYTVLITVLFALFCILPMLDKIQPFADVVGLDKIISMEGGKGLYGFLFMYILGGYLRLHTKPHNRAKLRYLAAFLALGVINVVLLYFVPGYNKVAGFNNNLFAVLQCVCLLLFFRDLHFKSRVLNYIAGSCLGVYMIHEHPLVRQLIWHGLPGGWFASLLQEPSFYNGWVYPFMMLAICCALFLVCALLDQVRVYFFKVIDLIIAKCKRPSGGRHAA